MRHTLWASILVHPHTLTGRLHPVHSNAFKLLPLRQEVWRTWGFLQPYWKRKLHWGHKLRHSRNYRRYSLCGTSWLDNNSLSASTLTSSWVWVAWVNYFIWMSLCFMSKLFGNKRIKSGLDRFRSILGKLQHILAIMGSDHIRAIIFAIASLLCFTAQFYLLSVFLATLLHFARMVFWSNHSGQRLGSCYFRIYIHRIQ